MFRKALKLLVSKGRVSFPPGDATSSSLMLNKSNPATLVTSGEETLRTGLKRADGRMAPGVIKPGR